MVRKLYQEKKWRKLYILKPEPLNLFRLLILFLGEFENYTLAKPGSSQIFSQSVQGIWLRMIVLDPVDVI